MLDRLLGVVEGRRRIESSECKEGDDQRQNRGERKKGRGRGDRGIENSLKGGCRTKMGMRGEGKRTILDVVSSKFELERETR